MMVFFMVSNHTEKMKVCDRPYVSRIYEGFYDDDDKCNRFGHALISLWGIFKI